MTMASASRVHHDELTGDACRACRVRIFWRRVCVVLCFSRFRRKVGATGTVRGALRTRQRQERGGVAAGNPMSDVARPLPSPVNVSDERPLGMSATFLSLWPYRTVPSCERHAKKNKRAGLVLKKRNIRSKRPKNDTLCLKNLKQTAPW